MRRVCTQPTEQHLISGLAQRAEAALEAVLGVEGDGLPLAMMQALLTSDLPRFVFTIYFTM